MNDMQLDELFKIFNSELYSIENNNLTENTINEDLLYDSIVQARKISEDSLKYKQVFNPIISSPQVQDKAKSLNNFFVELDKKFNTQGNRSSLDRILRYLEDQSIFANAVNASDYAKLKLYCENKFPNFSNKMLEDSINFLNTLIINKDESTRNYTYIDVIEIFTRITKKLNIDLIVTNNPNQRAKIRINPNRRTISIRDGSVFTRNEVRRLALHEIGVHYQRYIFGLKQNDPFLSIGMALDYILYEEGLAVYIEDSYSLLDNETLAKYHLRAISSNLTFRYDFSYIYAINRLYLSPDDSFDIALRSKRYISDTSLNFGYSKDSCYLMGFRAVKDLVSESHENIALLFSGKISPNEFNLIDHVNINYKKFLDDIFYETENI